jgi:hypothetical protein
MKLESPEKKYLDLQLVFIGGAFVNLDTVTDFFPWKHALPTKQV